MKQLLLILSILSGVLFANAQKLQTECDTLKKPLVKSSASSTKSGISGGGESSSGIAPVSMPIMPSPTAASLVRNATASPNLYTGAVNVSIPLYTLPAQGMSIPIGLVYQTNGIKVNEKNGPLGMTWSLQGGGAIARIVRGYPDEFNGEMKKETIHETTFYTTIRGKRKKNYTKTKKNEKIKVNGFWNFKHRENFLNGLNEFKEYIEKFTKEDEIYDTECDKYVFSAPGLSGSFYLPTSPASNTAKDPVIHCDRYIKVEPTYDNKLLLAGFSIITEDGTIYEFGKSQEYREEQTYENQKVTTKTNQTKLSDLVYQLTARWDHTRNYEKISMKTPYRSVWYLKQITTPYNADKIGYEYESTDSISELQGNTVTLEMDDVVIDSIYYEKGDMKVKIQEKPKDENKIIQSYTFAKLIATSHSPKRLKGISSSTHQLVLDYSKYNTIASISSKRNNHTIKNYHFNYLSSDSRISEPNDSVNFTYLEDNKFRNHIFDTGLTTKLKNDNLSRRYFLTGISEVNSIQSDSISIFSFEYNKPEFLPHRCSKFQNSYGFYCRYGDFKEFFPARNNNYTIISINGISSEYVRNNALPEIGILKSYKNATGAITKFKYNLEYPNKGAFLAGTTTTDGNDTLQSITFEYNLNTALAPYGIHSSSYNSGYKKKGYNIWCGTESGFTQGAYWEFENVTAFSKAGRTEYTFTSPQPKDGNNIKIYDNLKAISYYYNSYYDDIRLKKNVNAGRPTNRTNLRGKPLKIISYNTQNNLLFKKEYKYEKTLIATTTTNNLSFTISSNNSNAKDYTPYISFNDLDYYYLRPIKLITTSYITSEKENKKLAIIDSLVYGSGIFNQASKSVQINLNSRDTVSANNNYQLFDKGKYSFSNKPKYLINKQSIYKNGQQISGTKVIYNETTRLPEQTQTWIDGEYETTKTYELFDEKARLLQTHGKDNIPVSYRYRNGLPELTAQNATYKEIEEGTAEELRKKLPKALILSTTYTPEGFVASKTDANAYTSHYEYDDYGRLKLICDHDMNAIQAYDYQYGKVGIEIVGSNKLGIGQMIVGENFVVGGYTSTETKGQASAGKNYIASYGFKQEKASFYDRTNPKKATTNIEYQDGLGRAIQQIAVNSLPQEYNLVQAFEYDSLGRQATQYRSLPILSDSKYKKDWKQFLKNKYETSYKAESSFDAYNRIQKQGSFGENYALNKHASTHQYGMNQVSISSYKADLNSEDYQKKNYPKGTLYKTAVSFEGITNVSYKNMDGQVVRKAAVKGMQTSDPDYGSALITDYVYDDYGNLRAILPPQGEGDISASNYVYKFLYDKRNRLIKKEIPGAGCITMEYDELDRLIRETDAKGTTSYIKYDELSRPIETGYFSQEPPLTPPEGGESAASGKEIVLSKTFYDNYDFNFAKGNPCSGEHTKNNLGRITGSETRILGSDTWIKAVSYYDKEGRVIEAISQNNTGGIDKVATSFDFQGKVTETKVSKSFNGEQFSTKRQYDYGTTGELLNVHHSVNGQSSIVLSSFEYNSDGSLAGKKVHNGKIETQYTYDELDRMIKSQSEKYLTLELAYDSKLKGSNNTEYYDGSLSAMAWETKSQKRHTYSFGYDGWKNLCKASSDDHPYTTQYQYDANGNMSFLSRNDSLGLYQRFLYGYENTNQLRKLDRTNTEKVEVRPGDANNDGKVDVDDQHPIGYNYKFTVKPRDTLGIEWKDYLVIRRKGDQMVFSDSNGDGQINEIDTIAIHKNMLKEHQIAKALETGAFSYEYDDNGNMVKDEYKKISISYNILNLPDTITATGQGKIVNQYLADGTLLRRSIFDADDNEVQRIDYQGEFLFTNNQLDKIFTEEGYYSQLPPPTPPEGGENAPASGKGKYYYTLADHLGHTRVVVDEDENVLQETAYYPYGTPIASLSSETKYNYLYTGKEFLDNFGLNWYDHHARYFDPEVGRWWAIDPALQSASPYMAMGNNPMMYIDADGKTWNPFKAIGQALDYAWGKANQFAQWADQVGIPSVNIGYGMSSSGQIQPVGDINGHPLFSNESQYEAASQNAVNAINDARGDYFSQQQMNANYSRQLNNRIMNVPYSTVPRNSNVATTDGNALDGSNLSAKEKFNVAYDKAYNYEWGDAYVKGSYNGLLGRKFYYPSSSSYPKSLRRSFWFLSSDTPYGAGRNAGYIDGNYFGYLQGYKYGKNRRNNLIKAGEYVPRDARTQITPYDPISPLLPKWFEGLGW